MEQEFYNNDFEHFLKNATEDFRMYPSRKVWHSIYNDRHPARKWPSLAICLILVSTILFVGISNNNSINLATRENMEKNALLAANRKPVKYNSTDASARTIVEVAKKEYRSINEPIAEDNNAAAIAGVDLADNNSNSGISSLSTAAGDIASTRVFTAGQEALTGTIANANSATLQPKKQATNPAKSSMKIVGSVGIEDDGNEPTIAVKQTATDQKINLLTAIPGKKDLASNNAADAKMEEKAWIENYAFHNRAAIRKLKNRSAFQFYITPSIGYRQLILNNADHPAILSNDPAPVLYASYNNKFYQSPALNIEAGGSLLYNVSKRIRLKAGVQFNYTDYITEAVNIGHPVQVNLPLNNREYSSIRLEQRSTNLFNGDEDQNNSKLHNSTLQLSAPLGADFKIVGNDRLKWYVGATVQPTLVSPGKVYAISADGKSYIEAPSLVRPWNINSSVETFISYKMASGVMLNVGPQIRYQWLSTYNDQSIYTERLYNIGLKLGISTNL